MTVGAFRQLIQPFVKRGLDEFKVLRNPESYRFELKNDRKTLAEYFVTNGTKLLIEDGKPLRRGETPVKFIFYNLATGDSPDTFLEPLFELLIPEDMTVYEVKGEVCRALVADTTLHQNLLTQLKRTYPTVSEFHFTPDTIRLREINYLSLSTVYMDCQTLENAARVLLPGMTLAVEWLGKKEPKIHHHQEVITIQRFFPSEFKLGPREEIVLSDNDKIDDLRAQLAQRSGLDSLEKVSFVVVSRWSSISSLLELPQLGWDNYERLLQNDDTVRSLYLYDGDHLYFKDKTEPLKSLEPNEIESIKAQEHQQRYDKVTLSHVHEEILRYLLQVRFVVPHHCGFGQWQSANCEYQTHR
jgi:hypothetical protein